MRPKNSERARAEYNLRRPARGRPFFRYPSMYLSPCFRPVTRWAEPWRFVSPWERERRSRVGDCRNMSKRVEQGRAPSELVEICRPINDYYGAIPFLSGSRVTIRRISRNIFFVGYSHRSRRAGCSVAVGGSLSGAACPFFAHLQGRVFPRKRFYIQG